MLVTVVIFRKRSGGKGIKEQNNMLKIANSYGDYNMTNITCMTSQ